MIKNLLIKIKPFNSEKGAMLAEASFIMPIVVVVILLLVYLSLMQIQQAVMYMRAQEMAHKISNITRFPGYEEFYNDTFSDENRKLGLPETYEPSFSTLEDIHSVHDPYRYLGGIYFDKYESYEKELNEIIENASFFNGGKVDSKISVDFKDLSSLVKVNVNYSFELPKFVSLVGVDPNIYIKSEANVYANDTSEFIRNTDLAFDLFEHFLKKYHLDKKINTFFKKIKEFSK